MAKEKSWEHRVRLVSAMCCCSSRVSKPRDGGETTPLARMALVFASVRRVFGRQLGGSAAPSLRDWRISMSRLQEALVQVC